MTLSRDDVRDPYNKNRLNLYLSSIYVMEGHRNRGVASQLLKEIEKFCEELDVASKQMLAVCLNDTSAQLLRKHGFSYLFDNGAGDHVLHKAVL